MKSFFSLIMALITFISATLSGRVIRKEEPKDFQPVLRFFACSDTHIEGPEDKKLDRIRNAIDFAYGLTDGGYSKLDAVLFAGDITNSGEPEQFEAADKVIKESVKDGTEILALVAKNHDGYAGKEKSLAFVEGLTGKNSDFHVVINGFHFICISTSEKENLKYDLSQRAWLRKQLEEASADDPEKPIFVAHHEHVADTVYGSKTGSEGWGEIHFSDILAAYPQVIDISGHSHYPVNDPRSIWQGTFTAIGTASMHYLEFTVGTDRTVHPEGCYDCPQAWIIEVDKDNNVRLRGFDVNNRVWLCDYLLTDITDIASHPFTVKNQKALSSAPEFKEDSVVTVECENGKTTVSFPAAVSTDGMPVFLYRIKLTDETGKTVYSGYKINNYWSANEDKTVEFTVEKEAFSAYVCSENAYEMQSEKITGSIN